MALTVKEVVNAKPLAKAYKLADANGLYLYIATTGSKSWRCNYVRMAKQATKTFGLFPKVSLAEARSAHSRFKDGEIVETKTSDLNQQSSFKADVIERQLAHKETDEGTCCLQSCGISIAKT